MSDAVAAPPQRLRALWDALVRRPLTVWLLGLAMIAVIGGVDYATGSELRVYPLYFGPVSLLAWYVGRRAAAVTSLLCVIVWVASNRLTGMHFSIASLWFANAAVHGSSFLFVGLLIATLRRALREAREVGRTDVLTQLRNSRGFHADSVPLLALCGRRGRPVTIAYLDLDNFKAINDQRGHQAGDTLLREVADALRTALRPSDICARVGGDEFAVVLPELDAAGASAALERVRQRVNATVTAHDERVTITVGAVVFASPLPDLTAMLHEADSLMYVAKAAGKNRVTVRAAAAG